MVKKNLLERVLFLSRRVLSDRKLKKARGKPVQVGAYISQKSTMVKTCNYLRSRFINVKGCFPLQITLQLQAKVIFQKNNCCV